jgi:hypothetical protein
VQEPGSRSRHLYAGCRTGSKQVSPVLILEPRKNPSFDTTYICFDTSSMVRLRSSPRSSPATILSRDFSLTLTTLALYQRSLRWFEACSCKPAPRGQTLISCTVTCGYKLIFYINCAHSWHTSSRPWEPPPQPLPEPDVNLSAHPAPIDQP